MATIVGYVLLVLGGMATIGNGSIVASAIIARPARSSSLIPVVGGLFGFVGCALVPALGWKVGVFALALDPAAWLLLAWPVLALRSR